MLECRYFQDTSKKAMFLIMVIVLFGTSSSGGFTYKVQDLRMLDGKIVGGIETTIEEHPYQLSLQYSRRHTCGASLITPNVGLTAAHCTDGRKPTSFTIRAGSTNCATGGETTKVIKICQHPKFSVSNIDYDISVLHLERSLALSSTIRTISLQPTNKDIETGTPAVVTGWGTLQQGGALSSTLQEVYVPSVSHDICSKAYPKESITERMICFGHTDGGKDSCQGDSGGPLVVDGKLVGVVSWGYGCAQPKFPGVYAKVANEEITDHINKCIGNF